MTLFFSQFNHKVSLFACSLQARSACYSINILLLGKSLSKNMGLVPLTTLNKNLDLFVSSEQLIQETKLESESKSEKWHINSSVLHEESSRKFSAVLFISIAQL